MTTELWVICTTRFVAGEPGLFQHDVQRHLGPGSSRSFHHGPFDQGDPEAIVATGQNH